MYVLVTGMYEGYRILGIYSDQAAAQHAADVINAADDQYCYISGDARIEEDILINPSLEEVLVERFSCDDEALARARDANLLETESGT